ncbi:response regulator transcription factor [bacterium]|nr:response regulator transcription factor [bacterium]
MNILVVEDEPSLLEEILHSLQGQTGVCEAARTFAEAEEKLLLHEYDVVILDIMLPDGSGLRLLRMLREMQVGSGIIIISARDALDDKLEGLATGADDYLTKPFHVAELNARVQAVYRRRYMNSDDAIAVGSIRIEPGARKVLVGAAEVPLTAKEFELLLYFAVNAGRILSKHAIADHLWGDAYDTADNFQFVYVHLNNLRKKLQDAGVTDAIQTLYGIGYRMEAP